MNKIIYLKKFLKNMGDYDLDSTTRCEVEAFNLIDQLLAA